MVKAGNVILGLGGVAAVGLGTYAGYYYITNSSWFKALSNDELFGGGMDNLTDSFSELDGILQNNPKDLNVMWEGKSEPLGNVGKALETQMSNLGKSTAATHSSNTLKISSIKKIKNPTKKDSKELKKLTKSNKIDAKKFTKSSKSSKKDVKKLKKNVKKAFKF
jgi:hypothetical protein